MTENRNECSNCREELQKNRATCPNCGSNKRHDYVTVTDEIRLRDSIKGKVKNKSGKTKRKFVSRSKLSNKGIEAKEQLDIDIEGNRKFHHVEELDENGNWVVVHHEDEPLKKRPEHQS